MKKSTLGILSALIANLIFGFSFIFSKKALAVADVFVLLTWRFLIAFLVLFIIATLGIVKVNFKGKKLSRVILLAILQPFLYFIFEQYGILMTNSAFSGALLATAPVLVMAISGVFLYEKPNRWQVMFATLSLVGVSAISFIGTNSGTTTPLGVVILALAVLCVAFFNILSRKISGEFTPLERTLSMFFVSLIGFFTIGVIRFKTSFFSMMADAVKIPDFRISLFYLAILSSVVAFLIYNFATTHITATQASQFTNITTVTSIFAGVFILGEDFSLASLGFSLLIIIGVAGVNLFHDKKT